MQKLKGRSRTVGIYCILTRVLGDDVAKVELPAWRLAVVRVAWARHWLHPHIVALEECNPCTLSSEVGCSTVSTQSRNTDIVMLVQRVPGALS